MKLATVVGSLALAVAALSASGTAPPAGAYDLLIGNDRVFDGSSNPWFPADVAVKGGRIAAVGRLGDRRSGTSAWTRRCWSGTAPSPGR